MFLLNNVKLRDIFEREGFIRPNLGFVLVVSELHSQQLGESLRLRVVGKDYKLLFVGIFDSIGALKHSLVLSPGAGEQLCGSDTCFLE